MTAALVLEIAITLGGLALLIGGGGVMTYAGIAYMVVSRTGGEGAQLDALWDLALMGSAYLWAGTVLVTGFLTFSR